MPKMQKKALSTPDEKRSFDKGYLDLVTLGVELLLGEPHFSRDGNGPLV
jgi:hypothetical protein